MHIASFSPVYIHAVAHLSVDISIHNRDMCMHVLTRVNADTHVSTIEICVYIMI
jgi:hypothetical protein